MSHFAARMWSALLSNEARTDRFTPGEVCQAGATRLGAGALNVADGNRVDAHFETSIRRLQVTLAATRRPHTAYRTRPQHNLSV